MFEKFLHYSKSFHRVTARHVVFKVGEIWSKKMVKLCVVYLTKNSCHYCKDHTAFCRASVIDLYSHAKFHWNQRNFLWTDGCTHVHTYRRTDIWHRLY